MTKWECKNKKQYSSKQSANAEIYRVTIESAGGVVDLRCYKCKFCKKFHLTSSQKWFILCNMKPLTQEKLQNILHDSFEHLSEYEQDDIFDEMYMEMLARKKSLEIKENYALQWFNR